MREPRRALAPLSGLLLAGLILAAGRDARADAAKRVGLVIATRVNLTDAEADGYSFQLGEALTARLDIDVIAGAEARRRLPPSGIADDCVARPACVRDVATRLDGDELLFLFLVRIGSRVQIDVTWADPRRGAVTSRPALVLEETPGSPRTRERAFASAPRSLLPNAAIRPTPAELAAASSAGAPSAMSSDMPAPRIDDLGRRGRRFTTPVVVAGVVATAALATGIGFAIAARQDYQSLEDDGCDRGPCSDADQRVDRMERRALVADVMFAGAGAAAVTGLVLYLTSADSPPRVQVALRDGGGIVSFKGSF